MKSPHTQPDPSSPASGKQSKAVVALIAAACVCSILAVLLTFVRNQALNTDRYVSTVAPLAHDRAIQVAIATVVSNQLVAAADPPKLIKQSLPPQAAPLAGPITSALTGFVREQVLKLVSTQAFAKLWEVISRKSHEQLVAALTGKRPLLNKLAAEGEVRLNLNALVGPAAAVLKRSGLKASPPAGATPPEVVVINLKALKQAQQGVKALKGLTLLFDVLAIALFGLAIAISKVRRRTVIAVGLSLAFSMAVVGLLLAVGESASLGVYKTDVGRDAGRAFYETLTRYFSAGIKVLAGIGLVAAAVAWWTGGGKAAVSAGSGEGLASVAKVAVIAIGSLALLALANPGPLLFGALLLMTVAVPVIVANRS